MPTPDFLIYPIKYYSAHSITVFLSIMKIPKPGKKSPKKKFYKGKDQNQKIIIYLNFYFALPL